MWLSCLVITTAIAAAHSAPEPPQGDPVPHAVDHLGRVQFSSPVAAPSTIVVDQFIEPLPPPKMCKNKAGFSVRKASMKTMTSSMLNPTALRFQEVLVNQGGWEPSTNSFVAPCDGTYYFAFHALSNFGWGATVALMKNKEYQMTAYGDEAGYQAASNSGVLFLNSDDLVWLQIQGNSTIYEHPNKEAYTSFSGYLLESFHTPDEL
ncbi:unnamed protein product [Meganyctiphanes norvegica]|uniref:C1q domain-containing protein n=1 Tax=Meganyctiphanes norvegica TaxID=48144 RepID=A0AAV2Q0H6_MEGNR